MSYTYADEIATAQELLAEYGNTITIERDNGSFDPVTGTTGAIAVDSYQTSAVIFPATQAKIEALGIRTTGQTSVVNTIAFSMVAPVTGRDVQPGDRFIDAAGKIYYVNGVTPLDDQRGGVIVYNVALRV